MRYFIVHSEEDKQKLLQLKPGAQVLRNGHPVFAQFSQGQAMEKAVARRQLGLPPDRNLVLFFGLIRPYKGLAFLIEAMPRVLQEVDCSLLVAGEFYDDKAKYTALIEERGLAARVSVSRISTSATRTSVGISAPRTWWFCLMSRRPRVGSFRLPTASTRR